MSGVITQDQMQNLPLATRQPMDLALLMPGTSQDAIRPRKANSNIGAGAFTNGSALLVDGVWNKEGNTGEPRQDFRSPPSRSSRCSEPVARRVRLDGGRRRVARDQERHQPDSTAKASSSTATRRSTRSTRSRRRRGPGKAGLQPPSVRRRDRRADHQATSSTSSRQRKA